MTSSIHKSEVESLATTVVPREEVTAQAYMFNPTSADKTIVEIRPAGRPDSTPLYSAKLSTKKDPDVKLWLGDDTTVKPLASATVDKSTVVAVLSIHGETYHMGTSPQSGATSFTDPRYGKLKWKVKPLSGNPGSLHDEHGNELAKHKTVGFHYSGGPRELTLLRAVDTELFELMLFTVVIARRLSGIAMENIAIVGATV